MAAKYTCSQCERKFIDWGAEKLGYKCPDCDDSELKPIVFEPAAKAKKKPSLKRAAPKKVSKQDLVAEEPAPTAETDLADSASSESDEVSELGGFSVTDGSDEDA